MRLQDLQVLVGNCIAYLEVKRSNSLKIEDDKRVSATEVAKLMTPPKYTSS
jgi:hypothetical protein